MVRDLNIAVSPGKGPAYLKVAHALREALQRKILRPGEALPSSRRLAEMTGLHRQTVMAALEELIAEGWIVSDLRKCYRVSGTLPTEFFEATAGSESTSVGKEFEWKLPPRLPEVLSPPSGVLRHSFQSGLSDVRLFPRREFKSCWQDSFLRSGTDVLGARNGAGQPFFLETLDLYLRRVRRLSGRHIIATHGSQEGIYIAARLLLKKDDRVAVEALGYPSAWGVFQSVGAALEPIPLDTAGLDVEALEKKLKSPSGRRIRLIYTTPLHQYPTTATLPMDRRLRLYGLAVRYGVPILEDDYDHELHYRSQPLAPLASQDQAGCVIYLSTFSKVLFPAARLGCLVVPQEIAEPALRYKRLTTGHTDPILQETVARWIASGGFERHLRRMRRACEERRDALLACLNGLAAKGLVLQPKAPDGGMSIWVETRVDTTRLYREALTAGILVLPEAAFRPDHLPGKGLRLGFANQTPEEIRRGISLLEPILRKLRRN